MSFIPATLWFHQTSSDVQRPCEVPMNLATSIHFQWVDQPLEIQHGLLEIHIYIHRNLYGWCVYLATCYQQYRLNNQLDDFKNQLDELPDPIYIYMRTYCIYPCLFITLHLKCTHGPDFSLQCSSARHDPQQDVSARPNDPNGGGGGCSKNMQDGAPKLMWTLVEKTMK